MCKCISGILYARHCVVSIHHAPLNIVLLEIQPVINIKIGLRKICIFYLLFINIFLIFRNAYHGASPYLMGLTSLSSWRYQTPSGFGIHQVRT